MEDEWMFSAPGAIGARLRREASTGGGDDDRDGIAYSLTFEFGPDAPSLVYPVSDSVELAGGQAEAETIGLVEQRLSRHVSAKRLDCEPMPGVVAEWALSERVASPGLDQPVT